MLDSSIAVGVNDHLGAGFEGRCYDISKCLFGRVVESTAVGTVGRVEDIDEMCSLYLVKHEFCQPG